jgi:hypothetical protein
MQYKKYIFLFFILVFCFSDCKKYTEGPAFSLQPKTSRIRAIWLLESFLVNGDDSTTTYCSLGCSGYTIGPKGHSVYKIGPEGESGRWEFSNNKNNIIVYNNMGFGKPPLFIGDVVEWEIQRLTEKQFWLKRNYNSKTYYLKLKK